jgi:hypothetical protein
MIFSEKPVTAFRDHAPGSLGVVGAPGWENVGRRPGTVTASRRTGASPSFSLHRERYLAAEARISFATIGAILRYYGRSGVPLA